ncbi:unnamed protein product [Calypogeia fissa]
MKEISSSQNSGRRESDRKQIRSKGTPAQGRKGSQSGMVQKSNQESSANQIETTDSRKELKEGRKESQGGNSKLQGSQQVGRQNTRPRAGLHHHPAEEQENKIHVILAAAVLHHLPDCATGDTGD